MFEFRAVGKPFVLNGAVSANLVQQQQQQQQQPLLVLLKNPMNTSVLIGNQLVVA